MKKTLLLGTLLTTMLNVNAAIIYTDIADATIPSQGSIDIDFNGDQTADFVIQDGGFGGAVEPACFFNANAGFIMLGDFANGGWDEIAGIATNTTIDGTSNFANNGVDGYVDPMWNPGTFPAGNDTYIGATFQLGGNTHFGWIRVNWDANGTFIIKDLAYNDTADGAIDAGDEGGSSIGIESLESTFSFLISNNLIEITSDSKVQSIEMINLQGEIVSSSYNSQVLEMKNDFKGMSIVRVTLDNLEEKTFKIVK